MLEQWYSLTLQPGPRPALVLDVSESAAVFQPVIRSLVEGVLEILPPNTWPEIYFLGNPQPHEAAEYAAQSESWFRANSGRGSIISPIFEELVGEPDRAVVVVGSGRIFDLPDWADEPVAQQAVWCRYGPASLTEGVYPEEAYTVEQLAEKLNNPAVRIEISGPGVMPFFWNDPGFRWDNGKLIGTKTSGTLLLGVLSPEPGQVRSRVVLANGSCRELALEPADPPVLPDWRDLPAREDNLLRQLVRQGRYVCSACQQIHPAGQWHCGDPGAPDIFPTLAGLEGGFCLLDTSAWQTRIRPHPCAALQLQPDAVALHTGEIGAEVVRYDGRSNSWQLTGERMNPIHKLEDRRYVLVM